MRAQAVAYACDVFGINVSRTRLCHLLAPLTHLMWCVCAVPFTEGGKAGRGGLGPVINSLLSLCQHVSVCTHVCGCVWVCVCVYLCGCVQDMSGEDRWWSPQNGVRSLWGLCRWPCRSAELFVKESLTFHLTWRVKFQMNRLVTATSLLKHLAHLRLQNILPESIS